MLSQQPPVATEPELYQVFVYGSLKRGMSGHHHLEGATFLGTGITFEKYLLTSNRYPLLSKLKQVCHVKGEIYQVNKAMLDKLDEYEEVPQYYTRETIKVRFDGNEEIKEVEVYFCEIESGQRIHETGEYLEEILDATC